MYPWAPVFGRGYVLLALIAMAWLVRYRPLLPAVGGDRRVAHPAAPSRREHPAHPGRRDGAVPPLLAAAALARGRRRRGLRARACAREVVVGRGDRRGDRLSRGARPRLVLALARQRGGRRGDRRHARAALRLPIRDRLPGCASPGAVVLVAGALAPFVATGGRPCGARPGPARTGPPAYQTVDPPPARSRFLRSLSGPPPVILAQPDRGLRALRAGRRPHGDAAGGADARASAPDESERNHLGQAFFSPESSDARRLEAPARLHVAVRRPRPARPAAGRRLEPSFATRRSNRSTAIRPTCRPISAASSSCACCPRPPQPAADLGPLRHRQAGREERGVGREPRRDRRRPA